MQIMRFDPLAGSAGEALWREGEESYVLAGRTEARPVTAPPPGVLGWCAVAPGGEVAGLQACRLVAAPGHPPLPEGVAEGLLSWVRPAHRRRGVFRAIQAAVDADLLARGFVAIRSTVVGGGEEAAMAAAIAARGGAPVERRTVAAPGGAVTSTVYLRPLTGGG